VSLSGAAGTFARQWLARPGNQGEWRRLVTALSLAETFQFFVIQVGDLTAELLLEDLLRDEAVVLGRHLGGFDLSRPPEGLPVVRAVLREIETALRPSLFYFRGGACGQESPDDLSELFLFLNQKREVIAQRAGAPLLLALHGDGWKVFRRHAPDLWSIHQRVFRFEGARIPAPIEPGALHLAGAQAHESEGGGGNPWQEASALAKRATFEEVRGDWRRAEAFYRQALAIRERLGGAEHPGVATVLRNLGILMLRLERYDEAAATLCRALAIHERLLLDPGDEIASCLYYLGMAMENLGRLLEAETYFREAYQRRRERFGLQASKSLAALTALAEVLDRTEKTREADALWQEVALAVELGEEVEDKELLYAKAESLGRLAGALERRGRLEEALRAVKTRQIPLYEQLGDEGHRAAALGRIAGILEKKGEVAEAVRILEADVLPVFERLGDDRNRAATLARIATGLQRTGDPDRALGILRDEVLPAVERHGDVRRLASTWEQIAELLRSRGETTEALRILREEALPGYEKLGDQIAQSRTLREIADLLADRGDGEEAGRVRARADRILTDLGLPLSPPAAAADRD
jgi:tetratricopeptide (TPR) repeat protein